MSALGVGEGRELMRLLAVWIEDKSGAEADEVRRLIEQVRRDNEAKAKSGLRGLFS